MCRRIPGRSCHRHRLRRRGVSRSMRSSQARGRYQTLGIHSTIAELKALSGCWNPWRGIGLHLSDYFGQNGGVDSIERRGHVGFWFGCVPLAREFGHLLAPSLFLGATFMGKCIHPLFFFFKIIFCKIQLNINSSTYIISIFQLLQNPCAAWPWFFLVFKTLFLV